MRLVFVGAQGSGKGTQAKILAEALNIPHISTGDILRGAQGALKDEVDVCMQEGKLVPDSLMIRLLKERFQKADCKKGFILDGFPRTLEQAKALDEITRIDKVIEISLTDEEAVKRISSRLSCPKCGSVFNSVTSPPKQSGLCDSCATTLIQRKDDTPEAVKTRLQLYHTQTEPVLHYYDSAQVNGQQPIEAVTEDILHIMGVKNVLKLVNAKE